MSEFSVAILIPAYNEELTIATVVSDFRAQLPGAAIYVFDNASTDRTAELALAAGAELRSVRRRGKGNVVSAMYRSVDADVYVMVDGDDTYPAEQVHALIAPIVSGQADMVVGSRLLQPASSEFRRLNRLGNHFFLSVFNLIFGVRLTDILSGYRAMTREIVEATPVLSRNFEIETELTIRALEGGYLIDEIPVKLRPRPEGSFTKIVIARDGILILMSILTLFRDYRPLAFFGTIGAVLFLIGLVLGIEVTLEFFRTGLVLRFPTAILAASLVLLSMFMVLNGLVLDTVNRRFRELNYQVNRSTHRKS